MMLRGHSMMAPSPTPAHSRRIDKKKFVHLSSQEIARGDYLSLHKYKYVDASGAENVWEVAERRKKHGDADSVATIPVLRRQLKYDCLVLVKQYRPATKSFTIEFPSGLVEHMEPVAQHAALRRLHSQTGYSATATKQVSPLTACDPIHTSCTSKIVSVDVNGDDLMNLKAEQNFGEGEMYEVVQIPINDVLQRLNEYSREGYIIDSKVYTFAVGLAMGIKIGQTNSATEENDVHFVTNIIDQ